jgi:hypothetical protein
VRAGSPSCSTLCGRVREGRVSVESFYVATRSPKHLSRGVVIENAKIVDLYLKSMVARGGKENFFSVTRYRAFVV